MMCAPKRSAAWVVATPLFPFLVAAWVGGAARRKGGMCWTPAEGDAKRKSPSPSTRAAKRPANDIVDTALGAGKFDTLVTAVKAAGLVDTLKGDGPFTVFAPTDDAFAKLPEGTVEGLLEDKEKLTAVLTYHVVPGRVASAALSGVAAVRTVQGQNLDVDTSVGVKVGTAYVVKPDIETSNGVIHAIDSVLLPE